MFNISNERNITFVFKVVLWAKSFLVIEKGPKSRSSKCQHDRGDQTVIMISITVLTPVIHKLTSAMVL